MLKYLLIAVVIIWLLYSPMLRRARQLKRDHRPPAPASPSPKNQVEEMVSCSHCGIHLPASEAWRDAADRPYCSYAHREAGPSSR